MDPLGSLLNIVQVCQMIYTQVDTVRNNINQCKRLKQRVEIIHSSVEKLIPKLEAAKSEKEAVRLAIHSPYEKPLLALLDTLNEALVLIRKSSQKNLGIKFVMAAFDSGDFEGIYARLEQDLSQINLGLNVDQVLNREQDEADRKQDYAAMLSKQDEILRVGIEAKQSMQMLVMKEDEKARVIQNQLESMKFALQQMDPANRKKGEVSKKILVPFYELDIDRLLAKGSFGSIYLGRWRQQEVAIKMVEGTQEAMTEAQRSEFLREVKIMQRLRSEFVMPLYAVCVEPGRACMIMKYMSNDSLRSVLDDEQTVLTAAEKDRLILDIALGLNYLHTEGVLHRDVKSANVLLDGEGRARIADFGLSKLETGLSTLGQRTKDLQWMAPEVLMSLDNRAFTKAADVYSFGVVVWEILTGKAPYAGKKLSEISKKITSYEHEEIPMDMPEHYQQLLRNCWRKDRWSRPTMSDIVLQLREYQMTNSGPSQAMNPLMLQSSAGACAGFWKPPKQGFGVKGDAAKPEVFFAAAQKFEEQQLFSAAAANYKKASDLGYPRAKTSLALLHLQSKLGPANAQSKQLAHELLLEAAQAKHARGMRSLAYQFETGDGIPKDLSKAKYWYQEAANHGDDYAAKKVQELGGAKVAAGMRY